VKPFIKKIVFVLLIVVWGPFAAMAQDMREVTIDAQKAKKALMEKAAAEKAAARQVAAESRARIARDRSALEKAMATLEKENRGLETDIQALTDELVQLEASEQAVGEKLAQTSGMIRELVGVIRVNAKDIDALMAQNPRTALDLTPTSFLADLAEESRFPGMDDVHGMTAALGDLTRSYGEVIRRQGTIIDRSGEEVKADILYLGPFTALYRTADQTDPEAGFLNYSPAGSKLYALSRLPTGRMQKQITRYMDGQSETVPMDITRGGALRQLTHQLSFREQIPKGGPIVWPILAILALGVLIIIERGFFLLRKRMNADALIRRIEAESLENNWQACKQTCTEFPRKPVAKVVRAGLECCHMQREDMENALQEAILSEIPAMERFLSTLGMLAAIAPLLGLLGTVTGMIDTFHVITLYGTGDPRLMSGGISEALVTTMLGLSVAIPLMLAHTLLNRAVDRRIGQMEEKAVALVNIVHKSREAA
jgi:biopolymer transport protein ExbB